jgi:hypothetical protein
LCQFQTLCPALLNLQEMCYRLKDMCLCKIEKGVTYQLDDFVNVQLKQLEEVCTIVFSLDMINVLTKLIKA